MQERGCTTTSLRRSLGNRESQTVVVEATSRSHQDCTELAAGTAALLELIKAAVDLWKCLPFGSAPTPPPDLRRLESELLLRPRYPRMLEQHIPFTKSHESMAWTELVSIYDQGKQIRNEKDAERTADAFDDWVSGRPDEYRELLNVFLEENLGEDRKCFSC